MLVVIKPTGSSVPMSKSLIGFCGELHRLLHIEAKFARGLLLSFEVMNGGTGFRFFSLVATDETTKVLALNIGVRIVGLLLFLDVDLVLLEILAEIAGP